MNLKPGSRSANCNQLDTMIHSYVHANFVEIHAVVHMVHESMFWLEFGSLCATVILKFG